MKTDQKFDSCTLVSGSIVIRPLTLSDQEAIFTAGNDDEMQKWFPLPFPYTTENAQWFILDFATQRQEGGTGLVSAIDLDGQFAGVIDIKRAEWRGKSCEISYWTSPWARGKGVATEALVILSRWIILETGFQRLEVRVAPGNILPLKELPRKPATSVKESRETRDLRARVVMT
ncbi:MAG: GNAT family N-acetyltransferase [Actinobacteria bacterium]|nr:GNAT family N-acetyltransferase [Actinomycetota bacterium]